MTDEELAQQEHEIAELVADVRSRAIAEEREACAKTAEAVGTIHSPRRIDDIGPDIARAIRARTL